MKKQTIMDFLSAIQQESPKSIEVFTKKEEFKYNYRKKILLGSPGFVYEDEGLNKRAISEEEILKNPVYYIEDEVVYFKPHIIIYYTNGQACLYFENRDELIDYLTPDCNSKYLKLCFWKNIE